MPFSYSLSGVCEEDKFGSYGTLDECQQEAIGSHAKDVLDIIYEYAPRHAADLAPSDCIRILKKLTGIETDALTARMVLFGLGEDNLSILTSYPDFWPYVQTVYSDKWLIENLHDVGTEEAYKLLKDAVRRGVVDSDEFEVGSDDYDSDDDNSDEARDARREVRRETAVNETIDHERVYINSLMKLNWQFSPGIHVYIEHADAIKVSNYLAKTWKETFNEDVLETLEVFRRDCGMLKPYHCIRLIMEREPVNMNLFVGYFKRIREHERAESFEFLVKRDGLVYIKELAARGIYMFLKQAATLSPEYIRVALKASRRKEALAHVTRKDTAEYLLSMLSNTYRPNVDIVHNAISRDFEFLTRDITDEVLQVVIKERNKMDGNAVVPNWVYRLVLPYLPPLTPPQWLLNSLSKGQNDEMLLLFHNNGFVIGRFGHRYIRCFLGDIRRVVS